MSRIPRAGVIVAWKTMGLVVLDFRDLSVKLVMFNLIWCLTSSIIITLPLSTIALIAVCVDLKDRKDVTWRDFFTYMAQYGAIGLRWGMINFVIVCLIIINLWFYGQFIHDLRIILHIIVTLIATFWLLIQLYCLPLLFQQEYPSIRLAVRNAMILILRHPLYTLNYAVVAIVFIFMSLVVPYFWLIFTASFLSLLYLHAVDYLVKLEQGKAPKLDDELAQS